MTEGRTDRECTTIINISINDHKTNLLFLQKVTKKCNTSM